MLYGYVHLPFHERHGISLLGNLVGFLVILLLYFLVPTRL